MKPDYALKSKVLELGLDVTEREVSKAMFFSRNPQYNVRTSVDYSLASQIFNYYNNNYYDLWKEAQRLNHARYQRVRRLKTFIFGLISYYDCVFLTFKFSNDSLEKTSVKTRRTYVTRYLKSYDCPFVANLDFGKEHHREHYHAVIGCKKVDFDKWTLGNLDAERVRDSKNSHERLAKYVAKLTNHAIKETASRQSLIYSRSAKTKELLQKTLEECSKKYGAEHGKLHYTEVTETGFNYLPFTESEQQDLLFD